MKKVVSVVIFLWFLTGCSSSMRVPDIKGLDENDAKIILTNNALIPEIKNEFNGTVSEHSLISIDPEVGSKVYKNDKILLTYSQGPKEVFANDSTLSWSNINYDQDDEWSYYAPHINYEKNIMYIETEAILGTTISLNDELDTGYALATATINDPYDKQVPAKVKYSDSKKINKSEEKELEVQIPVGDLDRNKPTDFIVFISIYEEDLPTDIVLEFTVSWQ